MDNPTRRWLVPGVLAGAAVLVAGCIAPAAFRTGGPPGPLDVHCADATQAAEQRDDGTWFCPWGAAYDARSIGWLDAEGRYVASVEARTNVMWVNMCPSIALLAYPASGEDNDIPWQVLWGDAETGWGSSTLVQTPTGYLDCDNAAFHYIQRSSCFVLRRDQAPEPVACDPEIFHGRNERYDFLHLPARPASDPEVAP